MAKKTPPGSPFEGVDDYDDADITAVQLIAQGKDVPSHMARRLWALLHRFSATYDLSFRPGEDGRRSTDFAEGRRFVGLQLVKLAKIDLQQFKVIHARRNNGGPGSGRDPGRDSDAERKPGS